MTEEPRIGVYICHCGTNIAGSVDVKQLVEHAKSLPNVVEAKDYVFMCSSPGHDMIKEDVRKCGLNSVVVAACSPSMHEPTFRAAVADAGLNPYVFEMANIREHCAWVHSGDKERATRKATGILRMAVAKAALLEPLDEIKVPVNARALVVGGGVAGLKASLDLADRGFIVHLVEKRPTLGGRAARLGRVGSLPVRGADIVKTLIDAVVSHPRTILHLNSELIDLQGSIGNFTARIRENPRFVNERCNLCGDCAQVCPVEVSNEYEYGLTKRKAIFLPFDEAYPPAYAIDPQACTKCGECVDACLPDAINLEDGAEEIELPVGAVVLATGYRPYDPPTGEFGFGCTGKVLTLFQLERILDESGPTRGELKIDGTEPRSIAFIMCVGSVGTTPNAHPYCSRMCCSSTLKNVVRIREQHPDLDVYVIHKDIRTHGRGDEQLYEKASESLVKFVRFEKEPPTVRLSPAGVEVDVYESTLQENLRIPVDAIVLAVGMSPREDLDKVRTVVRASCSPEGFLKEAHLKLQPVEAPAGGIYLAGTVTGPKNVIESVMAGGAAAAKVAGLFEKHELAVEPRIAYVAEELCSGCGLCVPMCPYGAITIEKTGDERLAHVEGTLCMACGACVATCPSGALQQGGFKDRQILAQVASLLSSGSG